MLSLYQTEFALIAPIFYLVPFAIIMLAIGWRSLALLASTMAGFLAYSVFNENDPHDGWITYVLIMLSSCGLVTGAIAKSYQLSTRHDFREGTTIAIIVLFVLLAPDAVIQLFRLMKWP